MSSSSPDASSTTESRHKPSSTGVGTYNKDRPHQGIGMATPAERFLVSRERPAAELDPHLEALTHARSDEDWVTRKVSVNGVITVAWQQLSVGKHRGGRRVDIHVLPEIYEVWDGNELIRTVARETKGEIRKKRAAAR